MVRGKAAVLFATAMVALAGAPAALAQTAPPAPFQGVFAFQTRNFETAGTSTLSGAVVSSMTTAGTYRVELIAIQYTRPATGDETQVLARQLCSGTPDGDQVVITCQLLETTSPTYAPDNFRISRDGDSAVWNGELTGSGATVVFVQAK